MGTRVQYTEVALSAGNVISDGMQHDHPPQQPANAPAEPGYYEDGNFGIRIESKRLAALFPIITMLNSLDIIMAREVKTTHSFGEKPWLGFEHVTMVPMCRNLIAEKFLTPREVAWLNAYHAEVLEKTKGYFEGDQRTMRWLERETKLI